VFSGVATVTRAVEVGYDAAGSRASTLSTMSAELASDLRFQRARRIAGSYWVRVLVTLVLVGIVASRIDWSTLVDRIRHGDPLDFAIAVLLVFVSLLIGVYRWQGLLIGAGIHIRIARAARIYAVSIFAGTFLPTTLGGDVARALLVVRRGPMLTRAAITVIVERAGGLVGLLGIAWIGCASDPSAVPRDARTFLIWVTVGVAVASLLVFVGIRRGSRLARSLTPSRLVSTVRESRDLLDQYAHNPWLLAMLLVSSLVYQALVSLQLVFLGRAIGVHLSFATAAVTLALVTIVTLIPISIGGFGVREGSYVVLLGSASIGATDATLISLMSVAALFLASLPGAYILARGGLAPALEEGAL
jgi:glycosyltransferase 2 family protein